MCSRNASNIHARAPWYKSIKRPLRTQHHNADMVFHSIPTRVPTATLNSWWTRCGTWKASHPVKIEKCVAFSDGASNQFYSNLSGNQLVASISASINRVQQAAAFNFDHHQLRYREMDDCRVNCVSRNKSLDIRSVHPHSISIAFEFRSHSPRLIHASTRSVFFHSVSFCGLPSFISEKNARWNDNLELSLFAIDFVSPSRKK